MFTDDPLDVKVLVADGKELITWALKKWLTNRGYERLETTNSEEDFRRLLSESREEPTLAIVDLSKAIDGFGVVSEHAASREAPLAVLFITAYGNRDLHSNVRGAVLPNVRIVDVLEKPFELDELQGYLLLAMDLIEETYPAQ